MMTPGEPTIPWKKWKNVFTHYARVCGVSLSAERKMSLLLHCLGSEGQEIFEHLPDLPSTESNDLNDYEICLRKLDLHFLPKISTVLERHHFGRRMQRSGESIEDYITALRKLASTCNFGDNYEERLRDQFMLGCSLDKAKEACWEKDNPSFADVVKIAKSCEHTKKCVAELKKENGVTSKEEKVEVVNKSNGKVNLDSKSARTRGKTNFPHKGVHNKLASGSGRFQGTCFRCGEAGHIANYKGCTGWKAICGKCKRKGHVTRCCRSMLDKKDIHEIECVEDCEVEEVILKVSEGERSGPFETALVNDVPISMLFDSGAKISLIPREVFDLHIKQNVILNKPDIRAKGYGGEPITLSGYFNGTVKFKGRCANGKIYVSDRGDALVSWTHQRDLGVILDPNESPSVILKPRGEALMLNEVESDNGGVMFQREFPLVFEERLGCLKGYAHKIVLKEGAIPVTSKVRGVPIRVKENMEVELKKLLDAGIIKEVEASEWLSPVVMALKSSGESRLCVDLRGLNKCVVVDHYPLPNISEMLALLGGAKFFSSLDLTSAYHQIKLHVDSQNLTAFITPFGTFKFLRMPFGLISAAGVFQRMMEHICSKVRGIKIYQDDILVYGSTKEEHDDRVRHVLKLLETNGLTLKAKKCKFNLTEIDYLGHKISASGIQPKKELVDTIFNMASPICKEHVVKFLGMTEFYSKFIPNFARLTQSMRLLLKKGATFVWSKSCEEEFVQVKELLSNASCLQSFEPSQEIIIMTDASSAGLGAVMLQEHEGKQRTILFLSRCLRGAEVNYSVVEKESLAIFWAVRKLRKFVWGNMFTVKTDHKPLREIF